MTRLPIPAALRAPLIGLLALAVTGTALALADRPSRTPEPAAAQAAQQQSAPRQVPAKAATRTRTVLPVAPLRRVVQPDLMVTTTSPLTPAQMVKVRAVRGVTATTVVAAGVIAVGGRKVGAMGVDPSTFRMFTPRETAKSDALWASIAGGDVSSSYAAKLPLGQNVRLAATHSRSARIGAVAAFDLPRSDLVMNREVASGLGLRGKTLFVAAPQRKLSRLKANLRDVLGDGVTFLVLRPEQIVNRRPATYRELYMLSASYCPGLSWKVLAAIGQIESDHGRNVGPSSAGALGPMQFMPATWAQYAVDGDGDGKADIMSPYDAVPAASLYLCRNGAGRGGQDLYNAIFNYNHADWYVREVLALAARYR